MGIYNRDYSPPIPEVSLDLFNPYTRQSIRGARGFIDTGADGTCIPTRFIEVLKIIPSRQRTVVDFEGKETRKLVYRVTFKIEKWVFELIEVVTADTEEILIGRDILNQLKLELDGKNEIFKILDP